MDAYHGRQLFGDGRFGEEGLVAEMSALYREIGEPLHNLFPLSKKLIARERQGARLNRRHDQPPTRYARGLNGPVIPVATRRRLREGRGALNPFGLHNPLEVRRRCVPGWRR